MKKRPSGTGKPPVPPSSREDGAVRIGRYIRWLYGPETMPATLAEPLIDATFAEIEAVADEERRRALLREAMDRAYSGLGGRMKIGYARVSTDEQNLSLQCQALEAAGCERIFEDKGVSGGATKRPGLSAALAALAPGDVLTVWRLDRLGRSLPHLIELLDGVGKVGAEFHSLSESIDTKTAGGRLVFHMMGSLAEFERALIGERTKAGMKAAKRRGLHVGRPRKLTEHQLTHARSLIENGQETRKGAAALLGVDESTLRSALRG